MTEKEKAKLPKWALSEFEHQRIAGTTLWPQFERPVPVDPLALGATHDTPVKGWFAGYEREPSLGCSTGLEHSPFNPDKTDRRDAGVMYSSALDALKATRWAMAERMAEQLARIDAMIAKERETNHGV